MTKPTSATATLRRGRDLAAAGLIPDDAVAAADAVADRYSVALPPALARLIDPADPDDPIARQFVPDPRELETAADELADPIGDLAHAPLPGLVHRYPDRVLLMPTLACPVYCRFCFRRERVGRAAGTPSATELDAALAYVAERPAIREVILTGGDPLSLSDARLAALLDRLDAIPHLDQVRIHTRAPVACPGRVTDALVAALARERPVWMVLHCNHPREVTDDLRAAARRLLAGGVPLLAQTVLLRGVNDDVATLTSLMRALVAARIKPYYLHHPDLAPGTARFRLTLDEGRALVAALRGAVSGLCQPTYVVDIPGGHGKAPAAAGSLARDGDGWRISDWRGGRWRYRDPGSKSPR